MSIGQKLSELRKSKHLSQEEVADILGVTRQTISKWETDQSTPDFDKIIPLCNLYELSADELLKSDNAKTLEKEIIVEDDNTSKKKKAAGICIGILLYFVAIVWIMISIPVMTLNPVLASAIFILICGFATFSIVYSCIVYSKEKKENKKIETENTLVKSINSIIAMFICIIYLYISFTTFAWHITWIIWIIYALIEEIVKLIFMLVGNKNEE